MREIRQSGSEGGEAEVNRPSLPLSCERRVPGGPYFGASVQIMRRP